MSAITIENDLVHYEVLGRGRPVIFVHGWLGSWRYWVPTMQQLSMKYRTYALDLWGFGDSGKDPNKYGLREQVQLLYNFFERLGIPKAALIGHSLGAAVVLSFARQYPERAHRMMLISTPLIDMGNLSDDPASIRSTNPEMPVVVVQPPATTTSAAAAPGGTVPVSAPVPGAAAPAPVSTPATTPPPSAPAAATTSPAPSTPAPTTPAVPPATATPPAAAATTPPATATPAASTPAAATPPAQPAQPATSQFSSTSETIPRNPFRTRGETPEDILARLRAKNASTVTQAAPATPPAPGTPAAPTTSTPAPAGPPAPVITPPPAGQATQPTPPPSAPTPGGTGPLAPKPVAPVLPTVIAKPILPTTPAVPNTPPPATTPAAPAPVAPMRMDVPNPLVNLLTGIKPAALLNKYIVRDMQDVEALRAEVEKADERVLSRSAQSFGAVNLALELKRLTTPALLLHGEDDDFIQPPSEELLRRINAGKPAGHFLTLIEPTLRHFPMLETTAKFNRLLLDFLEAPDLSNVQFKDQWKRTMR